MYSSLFSNIELRKKWQEENKRDNLNLNLEIRKTQKNKIEEFVLTNENSLRNRLNLPTFSSYKEFMEREDDPAMLDLDKEVMNEAANILIDLVELKGRSLIAMNKKAS